MTLVHQVSESTHQELLKQESTLVHSATVLAKETSLAIGVEDVIFSSIKVEEDKLEEDSFDQEANPGMSIYLLKFTYSRRNYRCR